MIFSPDPLCKGYKPRTWHLAVRNGNVIIIPFWNENVIIPLSYSIIVALSSSFEETFLDDLFHSKKHFYNMFSSKTSFFCSATHPFKSRIRIPIICDPSKGSVCTTLLWASNQIFPPTNRALSVIRHLWECRRAFTWPQFKSFLPRSSLSQ